MNNYGGTLRVHYNAGNACHRNFSLFIFHYSFFNCAPFVEHLSDSDGKIVQNVEIKPEGVIRIVGASVCLALRYLRCRKIAENESTEPVGVTRRRTQVRREVRLVHSKRHSNQNLCEQIFTFSCFRKHLIHRKRSPFPSRGRR